MREEEKIGHLAQLTFRCSVNIASRLLKTVVGILFNNKANEAPSGRHQRGDDAMRRCVIVDVKLSSIQEYAPSKIVIATTRCP